MVIYGTGETKLTPSRQPAKCKCPQCGEYAITFHFFREYVHIFWIPTVPGSFRQVAYCEKCHVSYQESIPSSIAFEMKAAKDSTSTPFYHFSGLAIIIIAVCAIIYFNDGTTTHYYASNEKQAKGKYVNDKQEGEWTYWHENGTVESRQFYKDGVEDSVWTWYDEQGIKVKEGGYKKGAYHGKWLFYYPSGALQEEDLYVENRMHGKSTVYYENGNRSSEGNYVRDHQQGRWTYWYEDGTILTEGDFDKNSKIGIWKEYFPTGKPKTELSFKDSLELILNQWNSDGRQLIKNGNGISVSYYDSSDQKIEEGNIKEGLRDGMWSFWYPNGQLREQMNYQQNVVTLINSWDIEGKQQVKDGNGYQKTFYDNGSVGFEGHYRNGMLEGMALTRSADSVLLSEINYVHGKFDGMSKFYYPSGELYNEGEFKNNVQEGEWLWYHLNNQVEAKVKFVHGKKDGEETFYSESGEVVKREFYKDGRLVKEEMVN